MNIEMKVAPAFEDYIFDWYYETYLLVGGYGSGKSHQTGLKIILKLLEEKRKAMVVREVFDTMYDSCYSLLCDILQEMHLFTDDPKVFRKNRNKVLACKSPLRFKFPNGSMIIFKGMDKPEKVKSINGVSIIWVEEASEVKYIGFKELLGRLRMPETTMHIILTENPVGRENWTYKHFFKRTDNQGVEKVLMDEETFYNKKVIVRNGIYYHHSTIDDNPFLQQSYIKRLDEMKEYDYALYRVARLGRFGAAGIRVLPQLYVEHNINRFEEAVAALPWKNHFFGFDLGFEESSNATISCAIDYEKGYLYIYDEIYMNKITDDLYSQLPKMQKLKGLLDRLNERGIQKQLIMDSAVPKDIQYYRQQGFKARGAKKTDRLSQTRKIKRFKKIYVHPDCVNTIAELKDLTYKKKPNGEVIYDQFNIDPHTFSAIWYALDKVTVANVKERDNNSKDGSFQYAWEDENAA